MSNHSMITPEETGVIVARLAIHAEDFLKLLLCSGKAGGALLPEDAGKLESWAMNMRILRACIKASTAIQNKE